MQLANLTREKIVREQQEADKLKAFKHRNADDDGWVFLTAKNAPRPGRKSGLRRPGTWSASHFEP